MMTMERVLELPALLPLADPTEGLPLYVNAGCPVTDADIERLAEQEMAA